MKKLTLSSFKSRQEIKINYKTRDRFVVVSYVADGLAKAIEEAVITAFDKQLQKDAGVSDIMSITIGEGC